MAYTDYLPTIQADYVDEIFTLRSNKSIEFSYDKPYNSFVSDGGIGEITDLADYFDVIINTNYNYLNQTNKDFILDLYADLYKADGQKKSFIFKHPSNDEYYICKFISSLSETMERNFRHSYGKISFLAFGANRNLLSTSTWVEDATSATGYTPIGTSSGTGYDTVLDYSETLDYGDTW